MRSSSTLSLSSPAALIQNYALRLLQFNFCACHLRFAWWLTLTQRYKELPHSWAKENLARSQSGHCIAWQWLTNIKKTGLEALHRKPWQPFVLLSNSIWPSVLQTPNSQKKHKTIQHQGAELDILWKCLPDNKVKVRSQKKKRYYLGIFPKPRPPPIPPFWEPLIQKNF